MDRQTLALSDRSRTLYLEIRSERDSLVWSEKYPLVGGRGDGHIYIGENWPQGEYFLEGYAKSSFTSDTTEALRPRRIRVVDRVAQMEAITAAAIQQDSLQRKTSRHRFDLFPEGGDLVDGVTSTVAFKATYGPNHRFHPRPILAVTDFRCPRLSWLDGRCVQGPGTYSPRHG